MRCDVGCVRDFRGCVQDLAGPLSGGRPNFRSFFSPLPPQFSFFLRFEGGDFKHHQNSTEGTQREREETKKIVAGKGNKKPEKLGLSTLLGGSGRLWAIQFWPIHFWPAHLTSQFWPIHFWPILVVSVWWFGQFWPILLCVGCWVLGVVVLVVQHW